ncbi:MAG: hypothetical protein A2297_01710 [Elusimicrobia bacterium RIFOXYB2_FULL_48_7]|nr:MAG: hypothetical protein A2297_01710 [Elusimicrobia bacterium RIFOXYB2_FULL_48_7]
MIYNKTICAFAALLFFNGTLLFSQNAANPVTLDGCISMARKNNSAIKIQEQKILQSGQAKLRASGARLPSADFNYQQSARPGDTGSAAEVSVAQPLFSGFRNKRAVEIAESEELSARLQLENSRRNLDSAVAGAFYALAQTESELKNVSETLEMMSAREKDLLIWVNLGKARQSEIYMLQSQISVLRSKKQKISGDRKNALEDLSFLTGIEAPGISISENLPEPSAAETGPAAKYLEKTGSRSDIMIAKENVKAQALQVSRAKGNFLPALDFNGSWYPSRSGFLSGDEWGAGLFLTIPLYRGGINRAAVNEEQEKLKEYGEALSLAQKEARTQVCKLYASLESSFEQVSALKDAYSKSQSSYELQLKDYSVGMVTNLDVIQATLILLDVKNNLNNAVLQAKLNKALLDIAVK